MAGYKRHSREDVDAAVKKNTAEWQKRLDRAETKTPLGERVKELEKRLLNTRHLLETERLISAQFKEKAEKAAAAPSADEATSAENDALTEKMSELVFEMDQMRAGTRDLFALYDKERARTGHLTKIAQDARLEFVYMRQEVMVLYFPCTSVKFV